MLSRTLTLCQDLPINKQIIEADDGDTGVEALEFAMDCGQPIDCVLIDFTMVRMHGPEAVAIMRRRLGYRGLIVSVTGNVFDSDREKLFDAGVDHVLPKPMPMEQLLNILRNRRII